jgi:lysyl endopeptidase
MRNRLVALCLVLPGAGGAQAAIVATASQYAVRDVQRIDSFAPAALDLAAIRVEDAERDRRGLPPRFAIPERLFITPRTHGTWERLPGGLRLWRLRITGRNDTTSLNLGFSRFRLPPQARLLVYSSDGGQMLPPFTAADNEQHGQLWTPVLLTDDLVIELTVPTRRVKGVQLELTSVNQGYRGFGTTAREKSGSCNTDVECLAAEDTWREEMRAVAVISIDGFTLCTGSLLNNTANDRRMFFITAEHCGVDSSSAPSLVAYWNYQNSFCRDPGSAASGGAGDGLLDQFHTGSIFRASYAPSDMTLVELDDPPVPAYNHYWAGWDRSSGDFACTASEPCAALHHPSTDEKRITYSTSNTVTRSYFGSSPGDGTHIWAKWATDPPGPFTVPGVTEPGSSGSPLYNAAGRFIGQLHGGPSSCGATGDSLSDFYGRFSVSWTGGGSTSTRASDWLDPGNTGAVSLAGVDEPGFHTVTPCRLLDTRQAGQGPALISGVPRVLVVPPLCGVPAAAKAVAINLTAIDPTGAGHLTAYPGDALLPATSTVNFAAGLSRANNAILPLAANGNGQLAVRPFVVNGGTVHLVVDVTGYFRD